MNGALPHALNMLADSNRKLTAQNKRVFELEKLIHQIHLDLLMRAEPNSEGEEVVNLSGFLWGQICDVVKEGEE